MEKLTKKQRKFIGENYKSVSVKQMSKTLGVNRDIIQEFIEQIKISSVVSAEDVITKKSFSVLPQQQKETGFQFFAVVIIFLVAFIIYANSLKNEFVWDDMTFIVNNHNIKTLKGISTIISSIFNTNYFNLSQEKFYRPLVTLTYGFNYFIGDLNPFSYHLLNIFVHILNSILIFFILNIAFSNRIIAIFTAVIFTVHPIHTEAVTFISGRVDLLCMFFFLLAIFLYIECKFLTGTPQKICYLGSIIFFSFSLFSKEMGITLPLIILLYEYYFALNSNIHKKKNHNNLKINLIPFFIIAISFLLFRLFFLKNSGSFTHYLGNSLYITIITFTNIFVHYVKLLLLPIGLNANYNFPIATSIFQGRVIISLIVVIIILILTYFSKSFSKELFFSSSFFFITLIPVSNIIPLPNIIAERYLYIPSLGFCLTLSIILEKLYNTKFKGHLKYNKQIAIVFFLFIVIFFSLVTIERNRDWKNEITFFQKTIEKSPKIAKLHNNLGNAYDIKNMPYKAIEEYHKAIKLDPKYVQPYYNLGLVYHRLGQLDKAIIEYKNAINFDLNYAEALGNLGVAYSQKGMLNEAILELNNAIKSNPYYVEAHYNLGVIYQMSGKVNEARKQYKKVLDINPNYLKAKNALLSLKKQLITK